MKKIVLNISDSFYEKLKFEAIHEKKNIQAILVTRIIHKPFHVDVEEAFSEWMNHELNKIIEEK